MRERVHWVNGKAVPILRDALEVRKCPFTSMHSETCSLQILDKIFLQKIARHLSWENSGKFCVNADKNSQNYRWRVSIKVCAPQIWSKNSLECSLARSNKDSHNTVRFEFS